MCLVFSDIGTSCKLAPAGLRIQIGNLATLRRRRSLRQADIEKVEDWMYSSQRNYSGLENLLEIDIADL